MPIANRVNETAKHVLRNISIVVRYTDSKRHGLYYIHRDKLLCSNVVLNINEELSSIPHKYDKILSLHLSPGGEYIFIYLSKGSKSGWVLENRFELRRINSFNRKSTRVTSGFTIDGAKEGFLLRKAPRYLGPRAPGLRRKWTARDHYFDSMGQATIALPEYEYHF